jgi:hypothetical protein
MTGGDETTTDTRRERNHQSVFLVVGATFTSRAPRRSITTPRGVGAGDAREGASARHARVVRLAAEMDDPTSPGARMRKRAFLNERRRLKKRTGGVTPKHDAILEGVYELEPKPDWRTEARLANQLDLDPVAVKTWFRNRRVKDKRANARSVGTAFLFVVLLVLTCVYLWELDGLDELMRRRRETAPPNKRAFTKSGLPRPYGVKDPFENAFAKPKREYVEPTEVRSGDGIAKKKSDTRDAGRLSSYFSSASASATSAGSVRRAQPVDPDWDS